MLVPTPRPLKVTLLSSTENPLGTLYYVWEQSRTNDPLLTPLEYETAAQDYKRGFDNALGKTVYDTVNAILDESVPVTENIQFVFYIENMSISLREQMVRHRIGTCIGERTGMDIIPDLHQSTWWSQTTRVLPLDRVYDEGRFYVPDSLKGKAIDVDGKGEASYTAEEMYFNLFKHCQHVYNELVKAGVPREDARQVMPMGMTHGITWGINLKAMMHIFGKRGCWIAQAGLWNDMMVGMIEAVCENVDPMFRKIVLPPCIKDGKYKTCPIKMINVERIQGRDGMPPCPLFVYQQNNDALDAHYAVPNPAWKVSVDGEDDRYITSWKAPNPMESKMLNENIGKYRNLWQLNVFTGEPIETVAPVL